MSYQKKNSGDPLKIPAREWNYLLEMAEAFQSGRNASAAGTLLGWPTTFGKVRNDAGKDLYRWDVVGIDPPLILPSANLATFQRQVQFSGVDPVLARHTGAFAVLLAPLAEDAIGPAIIAGCAVVGVTVPAGSGSASGSSGSSGELTWAAMQSEGLVFAEIQETVGYENMLAAATGGSARILWCEDQDNEDGWRWAYVRLGAGSGGGTATILARLTGKSYPVDPADRFIRYTWAEVVESDTVPLTYTDTGVIGTYDANPAYHIDNVDLPVGEGTDIVELRQGAGGWYLIGVPPHWDFGHVTNGTPVTIGGINYFIGQRDDYDQTTKQFRSGGIIYMRDANEAI